MFLVVSPNALRLTLHGSKLTLCAMRYALCEKLVAIERWGWMRFLGGKEKRKNST